MSAVPIQAGTQAIVQVCPYCGVERQFNMKGAIDLTKVPGATAPQQHKVWAYECLICDGLLVVETARSGHNLVALDFERLYPAWIPKVPDGLPEKVARCLHEAQLCSSVAAWNSTAVMVRRAIEECTKEQGAKGRNLEDKIDNLAAKQVITPQLKEWAHEVRYIGNDGAHGKKTQASGAADQSEETETVEIPLDVGEVDAKDALSFADEFLKHIYYMPQHIQRRRAAKNPPAALPAPGQTG